MEGKVRNAKKWQATLSGGNYEVGGRCLSFRYSPGPFVHIGPIKICFNRQQNALKCCYPMYS